MLLLSSNICTPHSPSPNTCKCATTPKRPRRKAVNAAKRNEMAAEHKCFDCGGYKTWGSGKGKGPCSIRRYYECHSCFKVLTRDQKASNDELFDSTYMAGFDAAESHTTKKARAASDPLWACAKN